MKTELRNALTNIGMSGKVSTKRVGVSCEYIINVNGEYAGVYSFERHTFVD